MRDEGAVGRPGHDVGKRPASVNPELPLLAHPFSLQNRACRATEGAGRARVGRGSGRHGTVAVESGWKRARRNILMSDTVSFLAAALPYHFAVSDVQGFAYALGLTA